jgi:hypothetical protein
VGSRRQINISSAMRNNILHALRRPSAGPVHMPRESAVGDREAVAAAAAAAASPATPTAKDGDVSTAAGTVAPATAAGDKAGWAPALNAFDAAQREVLHLMKLNLWLKFQASPLYASLNRQVRKRAAIAVMVKSGQISSALLQGQTQTQAAAAAARGA